MNGTRVVPSTPIARSASTEHSRYAIAGVQPVVSPHNAKPGDIVGGFLVATNGRMLAVAPANFYDPPAKGVLPIIPSEAIPANVAGITINGKIESDTQLLKCLTSSPDRRLRSSSAAPKPPRGREHD